jgi:hypothetical protein
MYCTPDWDDLCNLIRDSYTDEPVITECRAEWELWRHSLNCAARDCDNGLFTCCVAVAMEGARVIFRFFSFMFTLYATKAAAPMAAGTRMPADILLGMVVSGAVLIPGDVSFPGLLLGVWEMDAARDLVGDCDDPVEAVDVPVGD